ncbi:hypothetical protein BJV74DRAFT_868853 [Russula compacta]|nr:hypothetical protein BJV74DRAFT_868853 [Russula compacta]
MIGIGSAAMNIMFVDRRLQRAPSFFRFVSSLATVEPLSRGCLPSSHISHSRLQPVFLLHLPCHLDDHPILAVASLATPLNLDPAISCFNYRPNSFDGVKADCPAMSMY